MKKMVAIILLAAAVMVVQAQDGKTIRAAQGSVIVVDKLPITLVVKGDTVVVGDIGIKDADSNMHVMMMKKGDHVMRHFGSPEKEMTWFSVDDKDSQGKKMRVHVETLDDDDKDMAAGKDKKVHVFVTSDDDKEIKVGKEKNIRVRVEADDKDSDPSHLVICEEKEIDSTDSSKCKVVMIKKIRNPQDGKEEQQVTVTMDDEDIRPVMGLGLLLKEKEGRVLVDKILEKVAPKEQPFKEGDQILQVDGKEVKSLKDFTKVYDPIESGKTVKVRVKRNDKIKDESFSKPSDKGKVIYFQTK